MKLSGKKILMIVAPKNFRDEELLESRKVLEEEGALITVASKGTTEATGVLGAKVAVDEELSAVSAADFDATIFVGGSGAEIYFDDSLAQELARDAFVQGKVLGAICIAPSILANAGVLEGKKATAFPSEAENLKAHGASYTGEDVTRDGKIITASGPQAATAFGRKVAELFGGGVE